MELTPKDAAAFRSLLAGMAERIAELEEEVTRLKAEHEEIRAEQAATRAKLDALLSGGEAKKDPGDETAGEENQNGA